MIYLLVINTTLLLPEIQIQNVAYHGHLQNVCTYPLHLINYIKIKYTLNSLFMFEQGCVASIVGLW